MKGKREEARSIFADLVPPGSTLEIGCCSAVHWKDYPTVDQMINRELANFGYKYDELAEFACPEYDMCDIDGYELTDERGDYMRKRIDGF